MIWSELCRKALQISNLAPRGQDVDPSLNDDALFALRSVLSEWSRDEILIPAFESVSVDLSGGQNVYTMGPGGDFTRRPQSLTQAILSNSTLGLTRKPILIETWDFFEGLTFPSAPGIPGHCFFNPTYPLAQMAFYPTPNSDWNCKLIGTFAWDIPDPAATISLPPGYQEAILDATAVKTCENLNRQCAPWLYNRARDGRSSIKQSLPVKDLVRDNHMARTRVSRSIRNWDTDAGQ